MEPGPHERRTTGMQSLAERLDSYADPWKPNAGDKLIGTVVDLDERTGEFGTYPIVTVRTDEGSELAFHAFHTVAKNELAKQRPQVGEKIGIAYHGKPAGKTYEAYRIIVQRDEKPRQLDWERIGAEAAAESVETGGADDPVQDDIPF
jgi:hypothetical protein